MAALHLPAVLYSPEWVPGPVPVHPILPKDKSCEEGVVKMVLPGNWSA